MHLWVRHRACNVSVGAGLRWTYKRSIAIAVDGLGFTEKEGIVQVYALPDNSDKGHLFLPSGGASMLAILPARFTLNPYVS
jgi:hypothetical protein